MEEQEFLSMLVQLSDAINKKGEKYVDMLRVLYRDLAIVKSDLENAKCAFDLFQLLIAPGILKSTDISVLFETIKVTGLQYLKEIINRYKTYHDEVKITRFSPHRQQVIALGKDFSVKDLQKVSQLYEGSFSSPWKLIQHLEDTSVLTENSMSSFLQRLNENKVNEDFNQLLVRISEAISRKGEKYLDMLRVVYTDLAEIKTELEEAKSAFDLFEILKVANILKATDISVLFETVEVTGLKYLKVIIKTYAAYPDEVKITHFSAHRQRLVALGKDFTNLDIQRIRQMYEIPDNFCSNPWKLITYLENMGFVSEDDLSSLLMNLKSVVGIGSTTKRPNLGKDYREASISKRPKVNEGYVGSANCIGESTMSVHRQQQQLPLARQLFLPQQLQQSQAQIPPYEYLTWDQPLPNSAVQNKHLQRPSPDKIIRDALTRKQKEMYKNENQMTPAIWHHLHKLDIAEVFTELNLLQSKKEDKEAQDKSTCIKREGRPTSLTDALGVIISTDSCKVLITGKGGMGKTTLLKYIAYRWATDDEHIFAGKLLFLINIREIKANEKLLDIIMKKIDCNGIIIKNDLNDNSIKNFLVKYDNEIVILLDGYDELERDAKDTVDLFNRSELQESTVVVTSRPDNTDELVKCCDVHIEVKGFSPSNIKKYIQNFFSMNSNQNQNESIRKCGESNCGDSLMKKFRLDSEHSSNLINKCELGELLIEEFKLDSFNTFECGGDHKEAFELCSSPLLLLQVCTIWEQKRVLPTYLTDLFKELICCILNQYLNRAGNKCAIASFDRIPSLCKSYILILGECMYEGLKENKLSIKKYVLLEKAKDNKLVEQALGLGFVYEDTPVHPGDLEETYTPPHKLIPEALAGLYLSTQIQKESLKLDEFEEIRRNKYLNMTRVFTIGFLGTDVDKLLQPWLISPSNYGSIALCLTHVKEDHEDDILLKLDKHMSSDMKAYSKQMCKSFRRLLNDDRYISPVYRFLRDKSGNILSSMYLFKLLKRLHCKKYNECRPSIKEQLQKAAIYVTNICSEMQCLIVVHTLFLIKLLNPEYQPDIPNLLLGYISTWKREEIHLLSAEMEKNNFKYECTVIEFKCKLNSSAFLIHFLKYAGDLSRLIMWNIGFSNTNSHTLVTGTILNEVIMDLYKANIKLELKVLSIWDNDLNDIDGTSLGMLFKIAPKLECLSLRNCRLSGGILRAMITECHNSEATFGLGSNDKMTNFNQHRLIKSGVNMTLNLQRIILSSINLSSISGKTLACLLKISPDLILIDMSGCRLSGSIVTEMMHECDRMNVLLKCNMLNLKGNDLSDIDGKSLAELVRVIHWHDDNIDWSYDYYDNDEPFSWSDYSLTVDNLEKLVESADVSTTFKLQRIDFSKINLSLISGKTIACILKISPDLFCINMSNCSLSGCIVIEMMVECCKMNVVLKDNMLILKGNDLSDIDGRSLVELVRVTYVVDYPWSYRLYVFKWSDYSLTVDNLEKLLESVDQNIPLNWQRINLSKIDLSTVSGTTLACLFKIFPDLIHIDLSDCSLSGSIVNEMIEECHRMNVVLKDNMLILKGNDLSDIDGKSLAELFRLIHRSDDNVTWPYDILHDSDDDDNDYDNRDNDKPFRWSDYSLTVDNLEKLVESADINTTFNLQFIDLSKINLSSISGKTMACLLKNSPDLIRIDMNNCSLSGSIVSEMMEECRKMNVVLNGNMLILNGNNLSDIDGKSLVELSGVIHMYYEGDLPYNLDEPFSWSSYSLTIDNLKKLVESVDENITYWQRINLSNIDLSSISGKTLAGLLKISPELININMSNCSLSSSIVNEMMEECRRMNVVLKDNMLILEGNDLSDIDGKSLAELVRIIHRYYECDLALYNAHYPFSWSDYSLTVDNLKKLVQSVDENIKFWQRIDLSNIDLSSVSGKTLAGLFKIFSDLIHIDMSNCSLSGRIVNEMMEECHWMNVVLKDNMIILKGNDLSNIDGKSLAELSRVIHWHEDNIDSYDDYGNYCDNGDNDEPFRWGDYSLTVDNLEKLVESADINTTLNWQRIDMSKINLSSVSGKTLACLFKISPHLILIDMSGCRLSGSIVTEMMHECDRMNVILKCNMLNLMGNDLSDIEDKLLAELLLFNMA